MILPGRESELLTGASPASPSPLERETSVVVVDRVGQQASGPDYDSLRLFLPIREPS